VQENSGRLCATNSMIRAFGDSYTPQGTFL
jgi:hypothetical protein